MCDRDVFEGDVELLGTLHQVRSYTIADGLTLSDKFGGVELGDDSFEDFVADGGKDTLVVVLAEILRDSRVRLMELKTKLYSPFCCVVLAVHHT